MQAFDLIPPSRCLFASFLAAFALRQRLIVLNARNAAVLAGDAEKASATAAPETKSGEIPDTDPRYVFMT